MPVIQTETSIAAGGFNTNLVAGSAFEYSKGRSMLSAGVNAAATGTFVSIQSGGDVILEESPPYIATVFPIVPDQMFYNDIMEPMDRLRIPARNPTGGAIIIRVMAIITPL
jgi:hypothetical protein